MKRLMSMLMLISLIYLVNSDASTTNNKFGAISAAKCAEFYPSDSKTLQGEKLTREYPHMVRLGFGASENQSVYSCGGSLISLQHVLTAAHCLHSHSGPVKYARLGDKDIDRNSDHPEVQKFEIKEAFSHPRYHQKIGSYDIAVLKLDREIQVTDYVKPACLYLNGELKSDMEITSTGWGVTEFAGEPSTTLKKVKMVFVNNTECRSQYAKNGPRGRISEESQICAFPDPSSGMFICQGDAGGPLQVRNQTGRTHYNIIGVTSFGKACGLTNSADVFTRVSYFVPWIENLVWGSE